MASPNTVELPDHPRFDSLRLETIRFGSNPHAFYRLVRPDGSEERGAMAVGEIYDKYSNPALSDVLTELRFAVERAKSVRQKLPDAARNRGDLPKPVQEREKYRIDRIELKEADDGTVTMRTRFRVADDAALPVQAGVPFTLIVEDIESNVPNGGNPDNDWIKGEIETWAEIR